MSSSAPQSGRQHTTKSWKSIARDRFKHSTLGRSIPSYRHGSLTLHKGGGGGKFTAGKLTDQDAGEEQLDPHDPNYDESDLQGLPPNHFQPSATALSLFNSSFQEYQRFKQHLLSELENYLGEKKDVLHASQRVAESLKDLDLQDYHYDLVYLLVKWDIESGDQKGDKTQRERIVKLIKYLHDHNGCVLTPAQIDCGLRKLHNTLDDLLLEFPHARTVIHNYTLACENAGLTENTWRDELEELEQQSALFKDQQTDKELHNKINKMLQSYLKSEDLDILAEQIEKLGSSELHFELVKCALQMALEYAGKSNNKAIELMNEMLAAFTGELISYESAQQGIMHFLENVEDVEDHYSNVLAFLSCFVARCVADHVFPLQLLSCPDMVQRKLAAQIMSQTKLLLRGKGAAAKLQKVWSLNEAALSPLRKPTRQVSGGSSSSGSVASPLSLGARKLSGGGSGTSSSSSRTSSATNSPSLESRKMSAGGENPFAGFVIGAKKPGTAAYELEHSKDKSASPKTQATKEPGSESGEKSLAEKERLDTFGMYDPGKARAARNSPFAARTRYL